MEDNTIWVIETLHPKDNMIHRFDHLSIGDHVTIRQELKKLNGVTRTEGHRTALYAFNGNICVARATAQAIRGYVPSSPKGNIIQEMFANLS
jgi:hypothetical protein